MTTVPATAPTQPTTASTHVPEPPALILGAYAALPADAPGRASFYQTLAELPGVRGLEIPFRDDLAGPDGLDTLASQLAPAWDRNIVTAVPGTMVRVWAEPTFGLASVSREGRRAALDFTRSVRDGVEALREAAGRDVVAAVELHSAPSGAPGTDHLAEAFGESLAELADWDWGGAQLLVEHCDAYVSPDRGEKRLLTLGEEIDVVTTLARPQVRLSLNWGRSALEAHDADAAAEHVREAVSVGLLAGITFSGAGPVDTVYAKAWMDGHLPLADDEPGSVMTAARVRQCADLALGAVPADAAGGRADERAAGPAAGAGRAGAAPAAAPAPAAGSVARQGAWYLGVKCQVPAEADVPTRVAFLRHILTATGRF